MQNERKFERKRDLITYLAVLLFLLIIAFELLLAILLPTHLRDEKFWKREVALQNLVALVDTLRSQLKDVPKSTKIRHGCVKLVESCMDEIAKYLRLYQESVNIYQILELDNDLQGFDILINARLKKIKKTIINIEKLDSQDFLKNLLDRNSTRNMTKVLKNENQPTKSLQASEIPHKDSSP